MEPQNVSIGQQIRNILGVAGGQESIKVDVAIDTQSAVMLFGALFFSLVLAGVFINVIGKKL